LDRFVDSTFSVSFLAYIKGVN